MLRSFPLLPLLGVFLCFPCNALDFEVAPGFEVSSAVAPGLIKHPVMATLDDRGRMFVAENAGVNLNKEELLEQTPSSIRLLEDTDRDGIYDKATVFADKLTFPQGALWVYDSLYVMSPPSLWRFADENGDGVAEVREELATGFDFTGNAADVHGPFLHPNGRLYWCHGRKGHAVPDHDTGEILYEGKGARIWSCQLSGGDLEPFAGGGMDNPVEIDFTDEGEIVGTVNLFYGRPRGDTLTHWVHGGVYPRHDQAQVIEEFVRTGPLLPEVHDFGHVAVSGMARYRSGALDNNWTDNWLVSHFNTARITRTRFVREESGFLAAETEEILEVLDPDAHLTDVLEDHSGDILAIDTGGWFRIGCPTSHIAKPDVAGGIYRISKSGKAYEAPSYPDWKNLTSEAVSRFLGAPEDWLADRAITELAVRGAPAIPELRRILQNSPNATERRNAVWTLTRMRFSEAADLIYLALTDHDPSVRQSACHAVSVTRTWQSIAANQPAEREIELSRNKTISGALAKIVRGDEARVARQAAVALGRMGEHRAVGDLLGRMGRATEDRMLAHSLVYALIEIDDVESTRQGLQSENPGTLSGVLQALSEMPSATLEVLDILPHLDSENKSLRATALSIATSRHEWDAALANRFFEWEDDINETRISALREIIPHVANAPPVQDFLTTLLTHDSDDRKRLGLTLLDSTSEIKILSDWESALESFLDPEATPELCDLTLSILAKDPGSRFEETLQSLTANESLPQLTRVRSAQALAKQKAVLTEPAFQLLLSILQEEVDASSRSQAIQILSQSRLTKERRTQVAEIAGNFTPIEMQSLMQIFRRIDDENQAAILATSLAKSPAFASLDPDRLRQIFRPFDPSLSAPVEDRIQQVQEESAKRNERIESLLAGLDGADTTAGKSVFESGKGSCVVCHRIQETGGVVGPNLSTIGRIRSARDLFESVLYPSESIARDFNTFQVQTQDESQSKIGLIETQSSSSLTLIDPAGQRHTLKRSDIRAIIEVPTSLMPPGLEQTLTPEELRDLVAYLLELK